MRDYGFQFLYKHEGPPKKRFWFGSFGGEIGLKIGRSEADMA
jgi:hypothetical protein